MKITRNEVRIIHLKFIPSPLTTHGSPIPSLNENLLHKNTHLEEKRHSYMSFKRNWRRQKRLSESWTVAFSDGTHRFIYVIAMRIFHFLLLIMHDVSKNQRDLRHKRIMHTFLCSLLLITEYIIYLLLCCFFFFFTYLMQWEKLRKKSKISTDLPQYGKSYSWKFFFFLVVFRFLYSSCLETFCLLSKLILEKG